MDNGNEEQPRRCFFLKGWHLWIMFFAGSESHAFSHNYCVLLGSTVASFTKSKLRNRLPQLQVTHARVFRGALSRAFPTHHLISAMAALRVGDLQPSSLHG